MAASVLEMFLSQLRTNMLYQTSERPMSIDLISSMTSLRILILNITVCIIGYFTAPVSGVYYFSFTSFFWGGKGTTSGSLYHNGHAVVSWYSQISPYPTSGSNSAFLLLRAGDKVNVCLWPNAKLSDNVNKYSSFSGVLLFPK